VPYSTTVVLQAEDEADAIARVRAALDGLGEFTGFEATRFAARAEEADD